MQVVITNLTSSPVYIGDIYTSVQVGIPLTITRSGSDLNGMAALMAAIADGSVSVAITPTAAELASGLLAPPEAVEAVDMAPVAAAGIASGCVLFRAELPVGVGGADDVPLFAAGALPFKFRVVDSWLFVSTAKAGSATLRDEPAGAGTAVSVGDTTATGRAVCAPTSDASTVLTPGATKGLFARRTDDTMIGEVFVLVRRES